MRALGQIIDGKLLGAMENISPLTSSRNLIERRLALQALGKLGSGSANEIAPVLEKALDDEENGVPCVAALAIGATHHAGSWKALLDAMEKHGNHMLAECSVIALRKLTPFPGTELADVVKSNRNPVLRRTAMRALIPNATLDLQVGIRAAMLDADRFTAFAAAEAMGNIRKTNGAVMPLMSNLSNPDPAVATRAAVSLGVIAARNEKKLPTSARRCSPR